jgi:hypothetical protein
LKAALLAFFLGVAGAHKFYLGNAKIRNLYFNKFNAIGLVFTATASQELGKATAPHSYGYLADIPDAGQNPICILTHIMEPGSLRR